MSGGGSGSGSRPGSASGFSMQTYSFKKKLEPVELFEKNLSHMASRLHYGNFNQLYEELRKQNTALKQCESFCPGVCVNYFSLGSTEETWVYVDEDDKICATLSSHCEELQFSVLGRCMQSLFPEEVEYQDFLEVDPPDLDVSLQVTGWKVRPYIYILRTRKVEPLESAFLQWWNSANTDLVARDIKSESEYDPHFPLNLTSVLRYLGKHCPGLDERMKESLESFWREEFDPSKIESLWKEEDGGDAIARSVCSMYELRRSFLEKYLPEKVEDFEHSLTRDVQHEFERVGDHCFVHSIGDDDIEKEEDCAFFELGILKVRFHSMSQPRDKWMYLLLKMDGDFRIEDVREDCADASFHQSIFYVGMGEPSRPLRYAKEAVDCGRHPKHAKIRSIWRDGGSFKVFYFDRLSEPEAKHYEALVLQALLGALGHFFWGHFCCSEEEAEDYDFDENMHLCNQKFGTVAFPTPDCEQVILGLALLRQARIECQTNPRKFPEFPIPLFE